MLDRRRFLLGAVAFVAAPTIVRAASIMPVRALPEPQLPNRYLWTVIGMDEHGQVRREIIDLEPTRLWSSRQVFDIAFRSPLSPLPESLRQLGLKVTGER